MTTRRIRPARASDLAQVSDIFYEAEVADEPNPPPHPGVPPFLRHELETGEMYVVEEYGRIVAYGTLIARGAIAYLAEFFVRRGHQCAGVGKALLRRVLPRDERVCCTLSSTDPRALALYIRSGMRPQWPNFQLRVNVRDLSTVPALGVDVAEAQAGDPELVRWDAEIGGRQRSLDHAYWIQHARAVPVWFRRQGRTVGYGYVQALSDDSLWYPEAITLGPIGALTAEDARACVSAVVNWARPHAEAIRIVVPAPHPSLATLLDAGFRITYVETFLSTSARAFADFERYIPSGSWLF